ncbi:MAG TPA: hypothetical protein VJ876_06745 [Bacteroidales bacterium]|nr:hypothetical protein [Bacteroidales bacterium]
MRHFLKSRRFVGFLVLTLVLAGCATYYQQNHQLQQFIVSGNFQKADQLLNQDTRSREGRNKLLYYLNHGYVEWMLNRYQASNQYFLEADRIIDDYLRNYGLEALALLTNPNIKPYRPEDFEAVMLHYYTALNYIQLNDYEDAVVECRRINLRLQQLNDQYADHKNRYQRDAFAHNLMGMIYDAAGDYNNAFIAYRNALKVYKEDYKKYFSLETPDQLKKDILRTAYLTGFKDEVLFYEKKFNMTYSHQPREHGEIIFFWLNGFGPVKDEWNIHFTKVPSPREGYVIMRNEELNMSFPLYIGNKNKDEKEAFSQLRFFKVAFPKYVERKPVYQRATIQWKNNRVHMEKAQDINEIAFKTLRDRMLREMGNALLRIATKKALELAADQENENLGTLLNIVNTLTEQADTRNWQTLPHTIHYARVPLDKGKNAIRLKTHSPRHGTKTETYTFEGQKNKVYFATKHTTASYAPRMK